MHVSLTWNGLESSHELHILHNSRYLIVDFDAQINGLNSHFLHLSLVSEEVSQPASVCIRCTWSMAFIKMNYLIPKTEVDLALISIDELLQDNRNIFNVPFQETIEVKLYQTLSFGQYTLPVIQSSSEVHILNTAKCHASSIAKKPLACIHDDCGGYDLFHSSSRRKVAFKPLYDSWVCVLFYGIDH